LVGGDWKRKDFSPVLEEFKGFDDDSDMRLNWKPIDYMKQYIDEDFFRIISNCTNTTSVAVKGRNIKTTAAEIERFFGISLFMSCVGYPRMRMYWQRSLHLPLVCDTMTRDRYFRIRTSLKVVIDADVSDDAKLADRLWKVRPLLVVMARYSHKGHDSIRYDITQNIAIRYDTIRKCFTVCKNRKQASNSA